MPREAWCDYIGGLCRFRNTPHLCGDQSAVGCRSRREKNNLDAREEKPA